MSCDALIIGGGPAGATAATLLAGAGWSVVVVERKAFPRPKVCGEYLSATNGPLFAALGLAEAFAELAGPLVRQTALFSGQHSVLAPLPLLRQGEDDRGRALSRQRLDALLLDRAQAVGAQILQPMRCVQLSSEGGRHLCRVESLATRRTIEIEARTVIAAHGSWDLGSLPTQPAARHSHPHDWLAFKAHFHETGLPAGLMPLLSFADGYGGMVHCEAGAASLSCCIRRSRLETLARSGGQSAGEAVLSHILQSLPVLGPVLDRARINGTWLSAGPIQPGIRGGYQHGIFAVGNVAGEAHPVVAEGISMAMQSAWLLTRLLIDHQDQLDSPAARQQVGKVYSAAWRRAFAPRIRAASAIAQWASRPRLVAATLPLLRAMPSLLTLGARLAGKAKLILNDPLELETAASPKGLPTA
ncbi:MAG: FAD-dependent monooxygenase [Pirellulaceae bacterium]